MLVSGNEAQFREQLTLKIEADLSSTIRSIPCESRLREAAAYVLLGGGKRVRPLLALSIFIDLGGDPDQLVSVAGAIEVLHSASLIHDDLPGLDNDSLRRGKPACHVKFGEATAILLGDLLVPHALRSVVRTDFSPSTQIAIIDVLAGAYADVCRGQDLDMQGATASGVPVDHIAALKTGSLFRAACAIPALAQNSTSRFLQALEELGLQVGITFQYMNDFLDEFSENAEQGREKGSDARNKKETFLSDGSKVDAEAALKERVSGILRGVKVVCSLLPAHNSTMVLTEDILKSTFSRFLP